MTEIFPFLCLFDLPLLVVYIISIPGFFQIEQELFDRNPLFSLPIFRFRPKRTRFPFFPAFSPGGQHMFSDGLRRRNCSVLAEQLPAVSLNCCLFPENIEQNYYLFLLFFSVQLCYTHCLDINLQTAFRQNAITVPSAELLQDAVFH